MNASAEVPEEASANVRQAARAMRDVFVGLTAEGFTEAQALQIIGSILAAGQDGDSS